MKKVILLFFVAFLCVGAVGCLNNNAKVASQTTPEDAVRYYITAVAENDLDKAMSVTAIDQMASAYDFTQNAHQTNSIYPRNMQAPSDYDLYKQINKMTISGELSSQIKGFIYSFLYDGSLQEPNVVESDDDITEFISAVNPAYIKELSVVRIDAPYPQIMETEDVQKSLKSRADLYGADKATEMIALIKMNNTHYWAGFSLLKYGNGWKISSMQSYIVNQPATGAATEVTEDAYKNMVE